MTIAGRRSHRVSGTASGARSVRRAGSLGSLQAMTKEPDEARIERRADLLPEEVAVGSDDPREQARVILEESDERTAHPEETREDYTQTPDPGPADRKDGG